MIVNSPVPSDRPGSPAVGSEAVIVTVGVLSYRATMARCGRVGENTKPAPVTFTATVEGAFQSVVCLNDESELKASIRGGQTTVPLSLPGGAKKLLAFAATRKAFDAERDAPRLKVKMR